MFISFIGIGQGGSSIVEEFAKRGYYSASINFSQKDLDSLEHIQLRCKLIGSEGIGKQRNVAIQLMNNNWDLATNFVKDNFSHPSIELIFVVFSTSGGSGSGIAPVILQLLTDMMPDKVFVACPIVPSGEEVIANLQNCLDAFEDLSNLDICILPIDNDTKLSDKSNLGKNQLYKTINTNVVTLIEKVISYTDKPSKYSVLDKKDLLSIFKTSGIATISEVDITSLNESFELSQDSFIDKIQSSWFNSPFVPIQTEKVMSAGIIYDGQENLMQYINMRKIFSKFDNELPVHLYEGYYNEHKGKVISILTGLSLCTKRLEQIEKIIESNSEKINELNNNSNQGYKSRTRDLFVKQTSTSQPQNANKTIKDISALINKFKR